LTRAAFFKLKSGSLQGRVAYALRADMNPIPKGLRHPGEAGAI
jgi:hypothetical protein